MNKLVLISVNAISLSKNFSELEQITKKFSPDVIAISETWSPHIGSVHLDGFHDLLIKNRANNIAGGVGLYVSKSYKVELLEKINKLQMN